MLKTWKASAVKGLATLFERENKAQPDKEVNEKQREELYAEIGKLTTYVAWLKKNKEVAAHLGYGDVYYFHRQFQFMVGMTPTAYRTSLTLARALRPPEE